MEFREKHYKIYRTVEDVPAQPTNWLDTLPEDLQIKLLQDVYFMLKVDYENERRMQEYQEYKRMAQMGFRPTSWLSAYLTEFQHIEFDYSFWEVSFFMFLKFYDDPSETWV